MQEFYTYREGLELISNLIFKKQRLPSVLYPRDTKLVAPINVAAEEVRCGTVCVTILGLKKATFGKFSLMEYWSRYWTQRRIIYGMDNYEKLTFGFKVSGKNRRTVYLVEWRRTVYLVEWKKLLDLCNCEMPLYFAKTRTISCR